MQRARREPFRVSVRSPANSRRVPIGAATIRHRRRLPGGGCWLFPQALTASAEPFAISDVVLAGFLRIVTNPRIFDLPTPMETALAFCQRLVDWPRASLITPGRRHWALFAGLCRDVQGPLVADAYMAALAIEHGCELVTTDSDFARFRGLRWRHPLAA